MAEAETFLPLTGFIEYSPEEMQARASAFYEEIKRRRTVRDFSTRVIPTGVLEECIKAAGTAPNGANMQPWHFVVVRQPALKRKIREAAEEEELAGVHRRAVAGAHGRRARARG